VERALRFCNNQRKSKVIEFLERLFNNNAPEHFFLYREPNLGLDEDCCAFLSLSIAVKAELHYAKLLEARILSLKEPFQHKLGHAVGTMYSRIGTEDWRPGNATEERFNELTRGPVDDSTLVLWIEAEIHRRIVQELEKLPANERTTAKLEEVVTTTRKAKRARLEEALNLAVEAMKKAGIAEDAAQIARTHLGNDPEFRGRLK